MFNIFKKSHTKQVLAAHRESVLKSIDGIPYCKTIITDDGKTAVWNAAFEETLKNQGVTLVTNPSLSDLIAVFPYAFVGKTIINDDLTLDQIVAESDDAEADGKPYVRLTNTSPPVVWNPLFVTAMKESGFTLRPNAPTREEIIAMHEVERDEFTARKEAYIKILDFTPDDDDVHSGEFAYIWNDHFIANLIRLGYKLKDTDTDQDLVDRYHIQIARNVQQEIFEQEMADPINRHARAINSQPINSNLTARS